MRLTRDLQAAKKKASGPAKPEPKVEEAKPVEAAAPTPAPEAPAAGGKKKKVPAALAALQKQQELLRKQQEQGQKEAERQHHRTEATNRQAPSQQPATTDDINALLNSLSDADADLPDIVIPDAPARPATQAKTGQTPLALQEAECIRLLLNYGARELEPGITLCQYVLSELHEIDFQTSPYNLILTLYREAYAQGDILLASDFLNQRVSTEQAIQEQAIHMTTPRYEISDGWQKHEIFVPSEEEIGILADAAYRNILRIKKMLAEQRMSQIQAQMREPANSADEADRLMLEFMGMKRVDMEISRLLGTVISG